MNTIRDIMNIVMRQIKRKIIHIYKKSGIFRKKANKNPQKYAELNYYYGSFGKSINWRSPELFDEKLNILKVGIYLKNELIVKCTDKYRVREYIAECGFANILNEFYGVWYDYKEINISSLPNSFVIKRNNDSGGVLVVEDKRKIPDLDEKIKKLGQGVDKGFGLDTAEYQYQYIEPCFICEKYIGDIKGSFPYDYKLFVMNGKVRYILVCIGRESALLRFMTDRQFNLFPVMPGEKQVTNEDIQQYKPETLSEMIKIAEKLAIPFPFVRVDLYQYEGKVLFGELTFTPMEAVNSYINEIGQKIMGMYLDVSEEIYSAELKAADWRKKA